MRFFMLYPNQYAIGNKPMGIASLAAMIKRAGHEFELFDCTKYNVVVENSRGAGLYNTTKLAGEEAREYKIPRNPERLPKRIDTTYRGLVDELSAAIDRFKPDLIALSALSDDYPLGLGLMRDIKGVFPGIPKIAGGVHATIDPGGVISEECFDIVCVGEGEYVLLDIGERIDQGRGLEGIQNLWIKHEDGSVEKNAVRPYEAKLDVFPYPDWSIYPEVAFYKPFWGYVYKHGDFEMSRGCPYKCSYCINVHLQEIYRGYQYHREKSIPRVIDEIKFAMEHYDIEFLKFWDETFLLMHERRMEEFRDLYSRDIGLPYIVETTGQSVTEFSAKVLQKTNCRSASLGMETGSPDMRKGLLHKPTDNEVYVKAFRLLEEHGVRKAAFNMIGLPTEGQADIFCTIALNRLCKTEDQSVAIFYPYKGTPIRDMMVQKGWMDDDFDLTDLQDYDFNTFTQGNRSVVRFKDMDSRTLNTIRSLFIAYVFWPVKLYHLIDHVKNSDSEFAKALFSNIQRITYFKKFGDWPPVEETDVNSNASGKGSLPIIVQFDDPEADQFVSLLGDNWIGVGHEQLGEMIQAIADGKLKPEFEMPADRDGLVKLLGINLGDESVLKKTRDELRGIARTNSAIYATGTLVSLVSQEEADAEIQRISSHPVQPIPE